MIFNPVFLDELLSPVRQINVAIEFRQGPNHFQYNNRDIVKSVSIERVGNEGKFFGFGICQKANVKLLDPQKIINLTTDTSFRVLFNGANCYPTFYISRVIRDENDGSLSITAYDSLYSASLHLFKELPIEVPPYKPIDIATNIANLLGCHISTPNISSFNLEYPNGANVSGEENLREILNDIAEITQTIYYIDSDNRLQFKRLENSAPPALSIRKNDYFKLDDGANRRLQTIASITPLGDDVEAHIAETGSKQYVRDNPFWNTRTDIGELLQSAINEVGGLTIGQFNLTWRGCPLLEPGDKIAVQGKEDNEKIISYVINDKVHYAGSLKEQTKWKYTENDTATAENPSTLGETLNQTSAKVDKVNKKIDIVVNDVSNNKNNISNIQLQANNIEASVQETQKDLNNNVDSINGTIGELTKKVEANMTAEEIQIEIQNQIANGVNSITTQTGFTFNSEGLKVSKTGSDISTTITEDGMAIKKGTKEMLVANNKGVDATNLHAKTYLIIGDNSRIEDVGATRTAVYWIGG